MNPYKQELYEVCQIFSDNPWFNQGGGGNISIKDSETMTIKASGFRIDEVTSEAGSVGLDLSKIVDQLLNCKNEVEYNQLLQGSIKDGETDRPSMESGFHALIPQKIVAHLHHAPSCFLLCLEESGSISKDLFPGSHWVPYVKPGLDISFEVEKLNLDSTKGESLVFLQNHGVIVSANSLESVKSVVENIEDQIVDRFQLIRDFSSLEQTLYDEYYLMPDQVIFRDKPDSKAYQEMATVVDWIKGSAESNQLKLNQLNSDHVNELLNLNSEKHRMGLMK